MTRLEKFATVSEIIASIAVVVSLIYVGMQVNLNTSAIQSATNQSLYQMNQDFTLQAGAEYNDLLLRFRRAPESISGVDSLRWRGFLNLRINLNEAVFSNRETGMIEDQMAQSWLNGLGGWACLPMAEQYWSDNRNMYLPSFVEVVDSAISEAKDRGCFG